MRRDEPRREAPIPVRVRVLFLVCIAGAVVSAPALALAWVLALALRGARRALMWSALAGLCLSMLLVPFARSEPNAAFHAFVHPHARRHHERRHHHRRHQHHRHHRHGHHRHHRAAQHRAWSNGPPGLIHWGPSAAAAWPHVLAWWLWMIPSAPVFALAIDQGRARAQSRGAQSESARRAAA
jgi:hypothetical protein